MDKIKIADSETKIEVFLHTYRHIKPILTPRWSMAFKIII